MEEVLRQFTRACGQRLSVQPEVSELAKRILENCGEIIETTLTSPSQAEDTKKSWFSCALFIAKGLVRSTDEAANKPGASSPALREILFAFDISTADFLRELPVIVKRAAPSLDLLFPEEEQRLLSSVRELQTAFVHSIVLAKKAKDLFQRLCNLPLGNNDQPVPILRLTWLLFVLSKAELLGPLPDLVTSFNLLVCVINVILAHLPRALGTVDFADQTKFPVQTETGAPDTLASIALMSKTSIEEIKPLAAQVDLLMQELLGGIIPADPSFAFPDGRVEPNRTGFPGLLGDPGTETALRALDERYEKVYRTVSEIDERTFLKRKEAEAAATTLASAAGATPPSLTKCQVGTPVRSNSLQGLSVGTPLRLLPSPLRPANHSLKTPSPVRMGASSYFATPGGVPGTPLTESMQLTAWLRDTSAKTSAQPTETLQAYFKACDEDVTPGVLKRLQELSNAIFPLPEGPSGVAFLQSTMARERRLEGIKLYYRVLENMLKAEEARTGKRNFTALLNNKTFHKCLLACAFEMVIASYRMVTLTFPAVLERLQLKAFDLCKLIETFVRHEPLLPRELKRHLFNIEEKMLEALAFERGSSLYPRLIIACSDDLTSAQQATLRSAASQEEEEALPAPSDSHTQPDSPQQRESQAADGGKRSPQSTPSKRSADESPDVSPPKLQKGANEERLLPSASGSPPKSPAVSGSASGASPMSVTPGGVRIRSGLLSPKRQSETSAFSAFTSPMRSGGSGDYAVYFGPLPQAFGSPTEHLDRPGRAVIADFLRKVLKLGLLRMADLCDRMEFDPLDRQDILAQVYTMVQHVIYNHTNLLYNRHLDQILLSALYGVCKVNSLKQITFKEIIQHYKKQPQAKTDVFRTVVTAQSDPDLNVTKTGDIIEFYNAVFIPTVKSFVLKLGSRKAQLTRPPALVLGGARRTLMSPAAPSLKPGFQTPPAADRTFKGTPPGGQVFVSPLRQSPKQPFVTPRSRMIFAGRMGESATAYQSPAKDLKYINSRIAAHSQQPIVVPAPAAENEAALGSGAVQSSSDHSCSTGRSSGGEPSHSNSRYSEPVSSSGRGTGQGSAAATSKPGSAQGPHEQGGATGLDMMARAASAAQGQRVGSGRGGSRLDELHNAAMLVANVGGGDGPPTANGQAGHETGTRRSRRQAGRAARGLA